MSTARVLYSLSSFGSLALLAQSFSVNHVGGGRKRSLLTRNQMAAGDNNDASMFTALCLVPPDEAWDTIQRARHIARDRTFLKWPPAIRLFHPFCHRHQIDDVALDIAKLVEKHNIEPFQITLSEWTIIPNLEAIEAELNAIESPQEVSPEKSGQEKEQDEIDFLISKEEMVGRRRHQERNALRPQPKQKKRKKYGGPTQKLSPRDRRSQQRRMYEEFNGPCVVVLEPDNESREKLMMLRSLLEEELFASFSSYSPTSHLASAPPDNAPLEFRATLPIGDFSTVTAAIECAKRLKSVWDPLSFDVSEFHLMAIDVDKDKQSAIDLAHTSWSAPMEGETFSETKQFGCDAMVMFVGEEIEQDDEMTDSIAEYVLQHGIPGGGDKSVEGEGPSVDKIMADLDETAAREAPWAHDLLDWLDDDDGWDEGTAIAIGRTHFYSGEMRLYDG